MNTNLQNAVRLALIDKFNRRLKSFTYSVDLLDQKDILKKEDKFTFTEERKEKFISDLKNRYINSHLNEIDLEVTENSKSYDNKINKIHNFIFKVFIPLITICFILLISMFFISNKTALLIIGSIDLLVLIITIVLARFKLAKVYKSISLKEQELKYYSNPELAVSKNKQSLNLTKEKIKYAYFEKFTMNEPIHKEYMDKIIQDFNNNFDNNLALFNEKVDEFKIIKTMIELNIGLNKKYLANDDPHYLLALILDNKITNLDEGLEIIKNNQISNETLENFEANLKAFDEHVSSIVDDEIKEVNRQIEILSSQVNRVDTCFKEFNIDYLLNK